MRISILLLFISVFAVYSCHSVLTTRYVTSEDIERREIVQPLGGATNINVRYGTWEHYAPDSLHPDHTPIRFIRVNFHWMNTSDSIYTPGEFRATEYTKGLVRASNYSWRKNKKMYLPPRNNTPVLPSQVRIVLTPDPSIPGDDGIYFHYDDKWVHHVHEGKNRTLATRGMYDKYGVQKDSVLNVFIFAHHPDSLASETYNAYGGGVALGSFIKIVGIYDVYKNRDDYWKQRTNLNHEIAHIYGLSHSWIKKDGCDDTPPHVQDCFARTISAYCDSMASNNLMDYVAEQLALTPCQIGRMHARMSSLRNNRRKYILPSWCELKDTMHIRIKDTVEWLGAKDLEGHITIERGGLLAIHDRVSMPPGGKITIAPGAQLRLHDARLHNDCGEQWKGIEIQELDGEKGSIVFLGEPKLEDMEFSLE